MSVKRKLLHVASRVGVPGLLTWVMLIGIYLWVRVPRGDWYWSDLAKYTVMVLVVSYVLGSAKTNDKKTATTAVPACEHGGDQVIIDSRFGLHRWCMDCGALKLPDEPSWTLPRPTGRPVRST